MVNFAERQTYAAIDLENLRFNLRSAKKFIGNEFRFMAVVKASAYGHGAVECSAALVDEGIDWIGVALVEEALEIRQACLSIPILCLGGVSAGQESEALINDITPVVFNLEQATRIDTSAATLERDAKIHIKIDTGMGRLGIRWDAIDEFISDLKQLRNIRVEALMTHFASADDPSESEFTQTQIDRFRRSVNAFETAGIRPDFIDMSNSPAAVACPPARPDMVRLGGILYGLSGDVLPPNIDRPELKPVMSLHSIIADIKDIPPGETLGYGRTFRTDRQTRIALVPIGYNDGYRRCLSNKSNIAVNGKFAPVVGRISMDWTIADITDVASAAIGDHVTLIGGDQDCQIRAEDLAALCGTISYEITCGISSRVPRRYAG
jgi:alanine racemase